MRTKMLLVLLSAALFGCSNDTPIQTVPASFNLVSPVSDSPNVSLSPRFEWGVSINPENEAVVYDLYIGESPDPDQLIASNLETTFFDYREKLELFETYYWKVVAKTTSGGETQSSIWNFVVKPIKYLSENTTFNGTFKYTYNSDGVLEKYDLLDNSTGPYFIAYGPADAKPVAFSDEFNNILYAYDEQGRTVSIIGGDTDIDISYDGQGRVQRTEATASAGYRLSTSNYTYEENRAVPLSVLRYRYHFDTEEVTQITRSSFTWDAQGNLTKRLVEVDKLDGNGFQFSTETVNAYDTMQNPHQVVIRDHFMFDQMHFFPFFSPGIVSPINSPYHRWVSSNNIVQSTYKYRLGSQIRQSITSLEYLYNEQGYPTEAEVAHIEEDDSREMTFTWNYLD